MLKKLKSAVIKVLESHPLGYAMGVAILTSFDFLLPHEADYHGFAVLAKRGLGSTRRILDLGANRGHSARAFLKLLPGWQVFSFEANPIHQAVLQRIKDRSDGRYDFKICGMGERAEHDVSIYTPFWKNIAMHSASALDRDEAERGVSEAFPRQKDAFVIRQEKTEVRALDSFDIDADFVKIDIQGAELSCLKGMTEFLSRNNPVLLVEVNLSLDPVMGYLTERGYKPFTYLPGQEVFSEGITEYNASVRNVFFVPPQHEAMVRAQSAANSNPVL